MSDVFTIVRALTQAELNASPKRITGVTASKPFYKQIDPEHTEFVVDVRIRSKVHWYLIKDCLVASWAIGAITDMSIPVLLERSEAGRMTVIARSVVALPDISASTYSLAELGLLFMSNLRQDELGAWRDGFGHLMTDPALEEGETVEYGFSQQEIPLDGDEFIFGETPLGGTVTSEDEGGGTVGGGA